MGITPSEEQAVFYFELGLAISQWAAVERSLGDVVVAALANRRPKKKDDELYNAFFSIDQFRQKMRYADTVVTNRLKSKDADWTTLWNRIDRLSRKRNDLAHMPALTLYGNSEGRRYCLAPRDLTPSEVKAGQKEPPGALFIPNIVERRVKFVASSLDLDAFVSRLLGEVGPPPARLALLDSPPTLDTLVSQLRGLLALRPPPSGA